MKNFLILFISTVLISFSYAQKALSEEKEIQKAEFLLTKNTISLSPINAFFKEFKMSYERRFGMNNSIVLVGSFLHDSKQVYNYASLGAYVELQYKKYMFNTILSKKKNISSKNSFGVYASPFIAYQYLEREQSITTTNYTSNTTSTHTEFFHKNATLFGLVSGLSLNVLKGRFAIDFNIGLAEKISFRTNINENIVPGVYQYGITGIVPKANFQLGYNF